MIRFSSSPFDSLWWNSETHFELHGTSEPLCEFIRHHIERCLEGHSSQPNMYIIVYLYLDIQKLTQVTKSGFQKSPLSGSWALILRLYGCLRRHDRHLVGEWCHFESHSPFGSRVWEWWYYSVTQASTMSSTDINSVYVHVLSSTPRKLT